MASTQRWVSRLLREPLVHFAWLAGLLIWLTPRPPDARSIDLTGTEVQALTRQFEQKSKRPPTPSERDRLIHDYLRDEVLRREAIAMGLHETDPVVKRRLIQGLEYLAETGGDATSPSDAELQAELAAHPARYRVAEELDFDQVFVRSGPDFEARANAVAAKLAAPGSGVGGEAQRTGAATAVSHSELGDAFLDGNRFRARTEQQLTSRFGAPLAKALFEQSRDDSSRGKWLGPFSSRYGKHWVLIRARRPGRTQRLDEARDSLREAVRERRREEQHRLLLRKAAARYRIRVEGKRWELGDAP